MFIKKLVISREDFLLPYPLLFCLTNLFLYEIPSQFLYLLVGQGKVIEIDTKVESRFAQINQNSNDILLSLHFVKKTSITYLEVLFFTAL